MPVSNNPAAASSRRSRCRAGGQGYSDNVIPAYLCAAEKFGRWLSIANLNTADVNGDLIARYVDEAVRPHSPCAEGRTDCHVRTGLAHLARVLRETQVAPLVAVTQVRTASECWLIAFASRCGRRRKIAMPRKVDQSSYEVDPRWFIRAHLGCGSLAQIAAEEEVCPGSNRLSSPPCVRLG